MPLPPCPIQPNNAQLVMPSSIFVVCPHCRHQYYLGAWNLTVILWPFRWPWTGVVESNNYSDSKSDIAKESRMVTFQGRRQQRSPFPVQLPAELVDPRRTNTRQHLPSGGYYAPNRQWVHYRRKPILLDYIKYLIFLRFIWVSSIPEWIPGHIGPPTQVTLQTTMQNMPSASDEPGYIYAFMIGGNAADTFEILINFGQLWSVLPKGRNLGDRLQVKIGREKDINGHSKTWSKHFRDFDPCRLFPGKSPRVPAYKKVEKLVLQEVKDLAKHNLDPAARNPSIPYVNRPKKRCLLANCELLQLLFLHLDRLANDIFRQCQSHRGFRLWPEHKQRIS
jgi:hypothetical protein